VGPVGFEPLKTTEITTIAVGPITEVSFIFASPT
jgi:hypothetical protein